MTHRRGTGSHELIREPTLLQGYPQTLCDLFKGLEASLLDALSRFDEITFDIYGEDGDAYVFVELYDSGADFYSKNYLGIHPPSDTDEARDTTAQAVARNLESTALSFFGA